MEEINPSVQDILDVLFTWAPSELALSWDNPGHTIGNPATSVKKIACALDASMESINFAKELSAQLLVTHHPLPLAPVREIRQDCVIGKRIQALIEARISFISLHTNLDAAQGGVNDTLCDLFNIGNVVTIEDEQGARLLRLGELMNGMTFSSFIHTVKEKLGAKAIWATGTRDAVVKRVAVCSGSGASYWGLAQAHGADCLLTGELRHHDALDAKDQGFNIIAAGHFETERPVVGRMAQYLLDCAKEKNWEVQVECFHRESSPIDIYIY